MSSTSGAIQVMEFVRALALAWKHLAVYPAGHPTLVSSLETVNRRLAELRGPAGEVTLGIATDGLIYGSVKIDSSAAQKLAQALHVRGVAIMQLSSETTAREVEIFLRVLAAGVPLEQKRRIWEDLTADGVVNINLQPVSYAALQVTDRVAEKTAAEDAPSLWEEILRALLDDQKFSERWDAASRVNTADELSKMIAQYVDPEPDTNATFDPDATFGIRIPTGEKPDELFVGFLSTTIGRQITQSSGMKRQHSLEQAVQLIRSLPDRLRGTILRGVAGALAADETAPALLRDFMAELPNDEVLEALRYLSAMGRLSAHGLALLEALSTVEASTRAAPQAESVIAELVRLLGEDDVDRFNPSEHQAVLANVAIQIPKIPPEAMSSMGRLGNLVDTVESAVVFRQFTQVLLDLIEELAVSRSPKAILQRLESACRGLLTAGQFSEPVAIIKHLQSLSAAATDPEFRRAVDESLSRLAAPDTIKALVDRVLAAPPGEAQDVQRLVETLGPAALRNLLLALAEEGNRSRRRRLFDFIASLGPLIVPEVKILLSDERWYVLRNMILLLRAVRDPTAVPELRKLTTHADLRVRMEAIRSVLAIDPNVPQNLLDDLFRDPDWKVRESAMTLVAHHRMKEGVDPLLRILDGNDLMGTRRMLRVNAIRTLGEIGDARALDPLERFFTNSRLPWPSKEERLAAWESLPHYPEEARARFVEKGLRSPDARVREVCERLRPR